MVGKEEFPSREFLLYWRANAVSAFGTYITLLALQTLVVLTLHGSTTEVGWLNSARWLPYLVVGVVVGALVDRHPRRPVMIVTDLVQAGLLATIPLLWWIDLLSSRSCRSGLRSRPSERCARPCENARQMRKIPADGLGAK